MAKVEKKKGKPGRKPAAKAEEAPLTMSEITKQEAEHKLKVGMAAPLDTPDPGKVDQESPEEESILKALQDVTGSIAPVLPAFEGPSEGTEDGPKEDNNKPCCEGKAPYFFAYTCQDRHAGEVYGKGLIYLPLSMPAAEKIQLATEKALDECPRGYHNLELSALNPI